MTHRLIQCKWHCLTVANVLTFETDIAIFLWIIFKFARTWCLKKRNFRMDLFSRVIFLIICADLISQIGYRWIFREDLFSRILVLSMFYIFWIFRDLFSARMLVTKLLLKFFDISNGFIWIQILYWMSGKSKGADIIKRFSFFFLFCLYLYCLISCKIFLTWSLKLSTT